LTQSAQEFSSFPENDFILDFSSENKLSRAMLLDNLTGKNL